MKVLVAQSCQTLCDSMNCSPSGSSVRRILQARIQQWVAMPSPEDLPDPGIKPRSPTLQADALLSEPSGKNTETGMQEISLLPTSYPPGSLPGKTIPCIPFYREILCLYKYIQRPSGLGKMVQACLSHFLMLNMTKSFGNNSKDKKREPSKGRRKKKRGISQGPQEQRNSTVTRPLMTSHLRKGKPGLAFPGTCRSNGRQPGGPTLPPN